MKKKTLIVFVVLILIEMAPSRIRAADRVSVCNSAANFARTVAEARDKGIPAENARAVFTQQAMLPYDRNTINGTITLIYGEKSLTPDQAAAKFLDSCMTGKAIQK